jgi:hypothetical protein
MRTVEGKNIHLFSFPTDGVQIGDGYVILR